MTWITCRLYGSAMERAASRARATSSAPMSRPAPTPRPRPSSFNWPTRAQTFVVPTSIPTKITSSGASIAADTSFPRNTVIGGGGVFDTDPFRQHPLCLKRLSDLAVKLHFDHHVARCAEVSLPPQGVVKAQPVLGVVAQQLGLRRLHPQ